MKVKLFKIYGEEIDSSSYDTCKVFTQLLVSNVSKWQEVDEKSLNHLKQFIIEHNIKMRYKTGKQCYVLAIQENDQVIINTIEDQIAKGKAEIKRYENFKLKQEKEQKRKKGLREVAKAEKLLKSIKTNSKLFRKVKNLVKVSEKK